MRKLFSFILAALLLFSSIPAFAEPETVDLSSMSLKELQALEKRVLAAMWATGDWQEVRVPAGAYKVGEDIPAGKWTIRPVPSKYAEVYVCTEINASGTGADGKWLTYEAICDKDCYMSEYFPVENVTVDIKAGQYIIIEDDAVLFTPFTGYLFTFK